MAELANRILTQRIALNRERIRFIAHIATNPATKLDIQRASDDLNEAAQWTMRRDVDTWTDLADSVMATVAIAEWRIRKIEETLRIKGRHGASDEMC